MPVNDKIRTVDYNDIRSKIIGVMGPGSADSGYGQTLVSNDVSISNKVSRADWAALRWDIVNAWTHIFGTTPVTVQPQEGDTIRYDTDFAPSSSMIAEAPVTQYDTYANLVIANKFTVHPSQSATFSWPITSSTWPGIYGSFWTSRIQCTVTASWTDATQARYFFNSGGTIRFSSSRTGGSSTTQNTSWTSILSSAGTQSFGGNIPTAGVSPQNGQNYYRCTSTFQVWYSVFGSSPYGSNNYRISARTPSVANNSTGTASSVEFLIEWIDNYVDPGNWPLDVPNTIDAVDGTFSLAASHLYATGVLQPPGTGNFTVQQPTLTIGAIAP